MSEIGSLKRKIRRLEAKLVMQQAELELYEMMAHDLASEPLIARIRDRFPEIATKWSQYKANSAGAA